MKEESGKNAKRKVYITIAVAFILISVLLINNSYSQTLSKDWKPERTIFPKIVEPGSLIKVEIKLNGEVKKNEILELTERIPKELIIIVDPTDSIFQIDPNNYLTCTLSPEDANLLANKLKYKLLVPEGTRAEEYKISGTLTLKVSGQDKESIKIKGNSSISVKSAIKSAASIPWSVATTMAFFILLAFSIILYLGWKSDTDLNKGEMRRAIAGTFVIGFSLLLVLSIYYRISQKEMVLAYINLVGVIIGFYFGSRIAGNDGAEDNDEIQIKHASLDKDDKIDIFVQNKGKKAVKIAKVYVNKELLTNGEEVIIPSKEAKSIIRDPKEKRLNITKTDNIKNVKVITSTGGEDEWTP